MFWNRMMAGCALLASLFLISCETGRQSCALSPSESSLQHETTRVRVLVDMEEDLPITSLTIAPGGKWLFGRPAIPSSYGGLFFRVSLETGEITLLGEGLGQGPGELTGGPQEVQAWGDLVLVRDTLATRIHVFSQEGAFLFDIHMSQARYSDAFQFENGRILTFFDNDISAWSMEPDATGPMAPGEPVFAEYALDSRHNATRQSTWLDYSQWMDVKNKLFHGAPPNGNPRYMIPLWLSPGHMAALSRYSGRFLLLDLTNRTVKVVRENLISDPDHLPARKLLYYHCGFPEPYTGDIFFIEPRIRRKGTNTGPRVDYAFHRFSLEGTYKGWHPVRSRHSSTETFITPVEGVCNGSFIVVREIVELTDGTVASRLVRMPVPDTWHPASE